MRRTSEAITPRTPDERLADDLKSIAIDTSGSNGGSISAMADLTFFGQDNFTTRISSDTTSYYSHISSDRAILRLVFLPYFFGYDLVLLPYFFGYGAYFFGYDNSTTRISSDTTRISFVFLRIGQFYDSYFFGYDLVLLPYFFGYGAYFFRISSDRAILRLVFLRIRRAFLPYFFG